MNTLEIHATNVGGIDDLELELDEETTIISGRNASNKTSLLKSIAFGLGSRTVPIRSGAKEARVELSYDGRTVERVGRRAGRGIHTEGDGWVTGEDETLLLERFATLLETNALRTAVATDGDVEALLKEPMDIDALERQQADLLQRRRELEQDLESLADVDDRLTARETELEEKREQVDELETQLEALYNRQESAHGEDEQLQKLRDRRADLRSKQERYEARRDDTKDAVARLEEELDELAEEIQSVEAQRDEHDVEALEEERHQVREELEDVTDRVDVLQSVLTANREMLASESTEVLGYESGLMGDEVTCWACGQSAERDAFDDTVDRLAELVEVDKRRKREREPEIEDLTQQIQEAERVERRADELEGRKRDVEQKLNSRHESLEQQAEQLEEIRTELSEVDDEIADHETQQGNEQTDLASDIEETRVELQTLRRDVDRLEGVCEDLRDERSECDRKETRVKELKEEIRDLTGRIENLEGELRETFNGAMDDLIDHLEFNRIDRVWLDGNFELVIAREVDGTVRQDSLEHLAESEREMIGLVLGLAGFLAYDAADVTPVLLLDSLGAFDAERTERLVDYFAERTEILLATVHPEMADEFEAETKTFDTPATL